MKLHDREIYVHFNIAVMRLYAASVLIKLFLKVYGAAVIRTRVACTPSMSDTRLHYSPKTKMLIRELFINLFMVKFLLRADYSS